MTQCELDHIVIGAASLEDGAAYISERLGVDIPMGGKHPLMGTHNRLMRIGAACFLEVIAIDPEAPPPDHARWFALGDAVMQERLKTSPQPITWVVRSPDIARTAHSSAFAIGNILPLSRGHLNWLFALPDDGALHEAGALPYILEWKDNIRPWERMADCGCRLVELTLCHPQPDVIAQALQSLNETGFPAVNVEYAQTARLALRIKKPNGEIVSL